MTKHSSARNASRNSRRQRQFDGQCCVLCEESDPCVLIMMSRTKLERLLEQHHVIGRINSTAATVPLCRNHHAKLTRDYMAAGASMFAQPTLLHRILMVLRSLAVFFPHLGIAVERLGEELETFIHLLDEHCPGWRSLGGDQ